MIIYLKLPLSLNIDNPYYYNKNYDDVFLNGNLENIDTIKKYLLLIQLILSLQKNTNIGLTFQFNL